MFKFFINNDSKDYSNKNEELLTKTASLLIHAAKIDENYTDNEKKIIKKTLIQLGVKESIVDQIMLNAEINEAKSNQILGTKSNQNRCFYRVTYYVKMFELKMPKILCTSVSVFAMKL